MLVVHAIQAGQASYYLGGTGPGRWVGSGSSALGLADVVEEPALRAVLAGHRPGGGERLLSRIPARRRAGFDLVLAAPKSVSMLTALASDRDGTRLAGAHERAVEDTIGFIDRWATWTRRGAEDRRIPTTGLVAAAFTHDSSWAGDPHRHTHLVVANLVEGADGRWSCLDSRSVYRHARAAGAIYQASLRHHLAAAGFAFAWHVRQDGLADVVGVPRPAIESCSQRSRQILDDIQLQGVAGPRARQAAAGRTRRQQAAGPTDWWRARAAAAGFDQDAATSLLATASRPAMTQWMEPNPPLADAIERVLIERGSWFSRPDTVVAIVGLLPIGAPASAVENWTEAFLGRVLIAGEGRWTTPKLKRLEAQLVETALNRQSASVATARAEAVEMALARRPELGPTAQAAVRQLTSSGAVDVLAGADLVTTTAVLDGARAAWEASGHRVAIRTTDAGGRSTKTAARWRALAGLDVPASSSPRRPTVLIVDRADRMSTTDLHRIVGEAAARRTKVVLIDGGTGPARREPTSPAFSALRSEITPIELGVGPPPSAVAGACADVIRGGRDDRVALAPTPTAAAACLVAEWYQGRIGPSPPVMVAIGPDEAEYLNAAARIRRQAAGELSGPTVQAGQREFQLGDEVRALRALRRDSRLAGIEGGATGLVTAVNADRQQVTIRWPAATVTLPAAELARLPVTHAYATTPAYVRNQVGPVLAFGDLSRVAPRLEPTTIYAVAPEPALRALHHAPGPLAQLLADLDPVASRPPPAPAAQRPLSLLVAEREAIGSRLATSAPGDPRPELRRVAEERAWVEAVPDRPDRAPRLADLDRRAARLMDQADRRAGWVEAHREALHRWTGINEAIATREAALGRAAELRPSRAVAAALGPVPEDDAVARQAWREAARAIESHRERWRLPDVPLSLDRGGREEADRHVDELRVHTACRAAERARTIGRERDLAVASR